MALSTTETEYMAAVEAFKEALWLRRSVGIFCIIQDSVQIYCDSQSAIHLAKNHRYHKRKKHIDIRYHRIHHWVVVEKVIDLVKISTIKNLAVIMTKTIPTKKFRASLNFINVL